MTPNVHASQTGRRATANWMANPIGILSLQRYAGNRAVTSIVVTHRDGVVAQRLSSEHGQHAHNGAAFLTASLTSPVPAGARVRYQVEYLGPPGLTSFGSH
jgi:hypothetical protein